jgi:hypothetical protein
LTKPRSIHIARNGLILERKWQVIGGGAVHVNGVKRGVRTFHLQGATFGNQQNMRLVAAKPLVEGTALGRQVKRFPAGNALDEYDRIRDAALRTNNQPFQIAGFVRIGVADLRIFCDGKPGKVGFRSRPLDRPFDNSAVGDGDNFVFAALARGLVCPGQQQPY